MDAPDGHRVLVLSAGVGAGHNSAAGAVRDACLARGDVAAVQVLDVLQVGSELYRDVLARGYFALVDTAPWLVDWGYDVSDQPFRRRLPVDPWTRVNAMPVVRALRRFGPTAIVCTHFLPAGLVAALLLRGTTDARTAVVTTDYDFQGLWLTSAFHRFFVAREEGRVLLSALGVPEDRVTAAGIPIAAGPAVRDGHVDAGGPPVLLVSAGAAGGEYATAVVRQTMHLVSDVHTIVVCGRNDVLRAEVEAMTDSRPGRYTVVGYTDEMPALLRRADLFVGKPGGLSSSECMAAGLPMVLVNPIPGQEVRNGDYLIEQGAAIRCNSVGTIAWRIDQVLTTPGALARMKQRAAAIGRPVAAQDVVDGLLTGPERPLVLSRAAQRAILAASERRVVASDLTGRKSLVRLVATDSEATVAVLRADEVADLRERGNRAIGPIVLDQPLLRDALTGTGWEARRLLRTVLRGAERLEVDVVPV